MAIAADTLHHSPQGGTQNNNSQPGPYRAPKRTLDATHALDRRLGKFLFDNGTLNDADFRRILAAQRENNERFSDAALRLGLVSERDVRLALARQCEIPAVLPDTTTYHRNLIAAYQPFSERSEAYRTLRTELMLRWFTRGHHCLAIGEARHNDGAANLAANLAWSCAQLGQRTLIIDANLRRPQIDAIFKFRPRQGLVDFLKGRCNFEDCLTAPPGFSQLVTLFAGKTPDNPQELLSLDSFGYLMETVADRFDIVIVTGPPVLECADMQIITAHVGGYILSTRRHRTRVADIESAQKKLVSTTAELIAVVLDN